MYFNSVPNYKCSRKKYYILRSFLLFSKGHNTETVTFRLSYLHIKHILSVCSFSITFVYTSYCSIHVNYIFYIQIAKLPYIKKKKFASMTLYTCAI